jgi:hypothetical protein
MNTALCHVPITGEGTAMLTEHSTLFSALNQKAFAMHAHIRSGLTSALRHVTMPRLPKSVSWARTGKHMLPSKVLTGCLRIPFPCTGL